MKYLFVTDLEGVAGVDAFRQTRTNDPSEKTEGRLESSSYRELPFFGK